MWGIFGHGNVAGLGQALEELGEGGGLRYCRPQNEQAMVPLAAAYAKTRDRLATFACTTSIGPGATNMLTAAAGATVSMFVAPGPIDVVHANVARRSRVFA